MGYRRDKEDRLLSILEQKEGDLRRKGNWLPKGRMIHLKTQIEELHNVMDQEDIPHPRRQNFIRSGQGRYTFDFRQYTYGYVPP
jgi:hypothetical protein